MLFGLIWGALLVGIIVYTVSYVITRYNIFETVRKALANAGTEKAKKAMAKEFEIMVKKKKGKEIKVDVLLKQADEKLEVTINSGGVAADIYENKRLYN